MSYPLYTDVRDGSHVLSGLYASGAVNVDLVTPGADTAIAEHPTARAVTGRFFSVLELRAFAGRTFTNDDDRAAADPVAVLSYAYWQRRFGADPAAIGRVLRIDGRPVTIVGVLPPNVLRYGADILLPLVLSRYPRLASPAGVRRPMIARSGR